VHHQLVGRRASERASQRQYFVQHHTERVHVGPVIDLGLDDTRLLRAHVRQGPEELVAARERAERLVVRHAEVDELDRAVRGQEQVRGLHVPVDHAAPVRVIQRRRGIRDDADHLRQVLGVRPRQERGRRDRRWIVG